jgi:hypothetical protein
MKAENRLQAIDVHSHWSTRRGYPLQTEAELTQQERTWRSKPAYRTEAEMAEDFRDAGVRVILDFGYTKYLPIEEANCDPASLSRRDHRQLGAFPARARYSRARRIPPLSRTERGACRASCLRLRRTTGQRSSLGSIDYASRRRRRR